jgi:hypothetical protein
MGGYLSALAPLAGNTPFLEFPPAGHAEPSWNRSRKPRP